jgi:precorrin-6B methylase 2
MRRSEFERPVFIIFMPRHLTLLTRHYPAAVVLASFVQLTALLPAQSVHPITGRPIAPVMGARGADWLQRPERELQENSHLAVQELKLTPGMVVADIGAGTGYYSIKFAKSVQPGGKVYAVDIQPEMLERLAANATAAGVNNIVPVLGTESNPNLPLKSVDVAVMIDVYHELSRPQRILQKIGLALKPDGRLVLLEFRKEDPGVPIRLEHKMSIQEIRREVEPEGYQWEQTLETLPWQHMVFFRHAAVN